MMRVAIDATPLSVPSGGIARYTVELGQALARNFPEDEFILVSDQPYFMPASSAGSLKKSGGPRNALERRWWSWGLDREMARVQADLFHGCDFSVPYLPRRPSVLTLHDLSPWLNTEWHSGADRVRNRSPLLIGLGLATMIVTPSEAVRRQAIERFRIHPGRIASVPLGVGQGLACHAAEQAETCGDYFLYVGALEPRKNIPGLIEAWRAVRNECAVDLVVAGTRRAGFSALAPEPGLHVLGHVTDERLVELYSRAIAFVYPSFYEGFGLPVLEAMWCGACVITSNDAAITEVALGAALQVDASEPRALYQAMLAVVNHPERFLQMRVRARQRAREFSWDRTARLTRDVYDEAWSRFYT